MSNIKLLSLVRNLIFVLTLFLCGCVSIPQQKFDAANNAGIKKIALLQVLQPADYSVSYDAAGAGAVGGVLGGAIGGLIVGSIIAADFSRKSSAFTEQVKTRNLSLNAEMASALESELRAKNYEVVYIPEQRPALKDGAEGKEADYSTIQTDADAILFVWMPMVGYRSVSSSDGKYIPWMRVIARFVAKKSNSLLYLQTINYGAKVLQRDEIHDIPADPKYAYPEFEDLLEKTDEAIQGLRKGIGPIAAKIASDLR